MVIDLDTVMPGTPLFDFGDLVRSSVSLAAEDATALGQVVAERELFEALLEGYLGGSGGLLTPAERALLEPAGRVITWEQAIRFLTDYLEGDTYFATSHREHNLERARAQLALLASLEEQREEFERCGAESWVVSRESRSRSQSTVVRLDVGAAHRRGQQPREPDAADHEHDDPHRGLGPLAVEHASRAEQRRVDEEAAEHPAEQRLRQAVGRRPEPGGGADRRPAGTGGPHAAIERLERGRVGGLREIGRRRATRRSWSATVASSETCDGTPCPFFAATKNPADTTNELTIAAISLQALMRHQNQRSR